jgi:hypothetical protein
MTGRGNNKTAMHFVAVLFVCLLIVFLGIRWNASAMPEQSTHVGSSAILSDDVFAIVTLNKGWKQSELSQAIASLYNLSQESRTLLVLKNGSLISIDDENRSEHIKNASRAHGWFWPSYMGSVHYTGNEQATPVLRGSNEIKIPMPSVKGEIQSSWTNSIRGYHTFCEGPCNKMIDPRLPNATVLNQSDIFHTTDGNIVIHFSEEAQKSDIFDLLTRSAQISQPSIKQMRLADGTQYDELIPSTDVKKDSNFIQDIEVTTISSGDFSWLVVRSDDGIIASTSLDRLLERLSTTLLTNRICDKRPIWFMTRNTSQISAKDTLSVVRSKNHITICK